jgi:uroporphyrinogen-III synthase
VTDRFGIEDAFEIGRGSAGAPVFLIARCDETDGPLAEALAARGARVLRLPLLVFDPGPDLEALATWLAEPPEGTAIAWTSRRAAEALVAHGLPRHAARLRAMPLFALGAESAGPAVQAGLPVEIPDDPRDAQRLAAHLSARAGVHRVAVLHGDRALPDLRDGLRAAGLEVTSFEVYRTRFASPDMGEVARALAADRLCAVAYFSPSAVEALERLLAPESLSGLRGRVVAIARGGTTHDALRERGYRRAIDPSASGLTLEAAALDILDSLMRTRSE